MPILIIFFIKLVYQNHYYHYYHHNFKSLLDILNQYVCLYKKISKVTLIIKIFCSVLDILLSKNRNIYLLNNFVMPA